MLQIQNKRSGVVSPMTKEEWKDVQKNPLWERKFFEVDAKKPQEVKDMEARKANSANKVEAPATPAVAKQTVSNAEQSIQTVKK